MTVAPPDDWPYAADPEVCAACGSDDDRFAVVDSLGLVWGGAMDGGLAPTRVGGYVGTLEFRCCHDCWSGGVETLEGARTLVADDARPGNDAVALDDERVAAAATLDADRVAVGALRALDVRSAPEREHVRSQDRAVEDALDAWFDE